MVTITKTVVIPYLTWLYTNWAKELGHQQHRINIGKTYRYNKQKTAKWIEI